MKGRGPLSTAGVIISGITFFAGLVAEESMPTTTPKPRAGGKEKKVTPALKKRVNQLVADLATESFERRQQAQEALVKLGPVISPLLKAYESDQDLERRNRIHEIKTKLRFLSYGKWAEEVAQAEAALNQDPYQHELRCWLAWKYYYFVGEYDLALDHFSILIDGDEVLNRVKAESYNGMAEIYRDREEINRAIELHKKGISLHPTPSGCHNLAWMYNTHRKDFKAAIELCRQALKIGPEYTYGRISLAVFLANAGQLEEAKSLIDATDKKPPIRHYNLAVYYTIIGELDEALKYVRTYLYEFQTVIKKRNKMRDNILSDWHLAPLLKDPRFMALMKKESDESSLDQKWIGKRIEQVVRGLNLKLAKQFVLDEPPGVGRAVFGNASSGDQVYLYVSRKDAITRESKIWSFKEFVGRRVTGIARKQGGKWHLTGGVIERLHKDEGQ